MRLLAAELALALFMTAFASSARGGGHTGSGRGAAAPGGKGANGGLGCPSGARSHSSGSSIKELDAYRRGALQRRKPGPAAGKKDGAGPRHLGPRVAAGEPRGPRARPGGKNGETPE